MKRWLWIGSLALGASLLVACNQSGGSNEGVGSTQRVIVRQLDTQAARVLYRLENASHWLPLNLTGGVASFAAQGGYEVVARCPQSVLFFKQTVQRRDQIVFTCSSTSSSSATYRNFEVNVPASVGGSPVRIGDMIFLGWRIEQYRGINPVPLYGVPLEPGSGEVLVTLLQYDGADLPFKPLGYRAVRVDANAPGTVLVDREGWQPFAGKRTVYAAGPTGYTLSGVVLYLHDSHLTFSTVAVSLLAGGVYNLALSYGLLPAGQGGVYLASIGAWQERDTSPSLASNLLLAYKDVGTSNWNASLPAPWTPGQVVVQGGQLTVRRSDAVRFVVYLGGFLEDSSTRQALDLEADFQASPSGPTVYTVPLVPELGYSLATNPSGRFTLTAFTRDQKSELLSLYALRRPRPYSEGEARGADIALAQAQGEYAGSFLSLP
jgi:hypothetical protein